MRKTSPYHLTKVCTLLIAATLGLTLTGCIPNAERTHLDGVTVGALDKPATNTNTVLAWANEAATTAYTYDFTNYQTQLQNASRYFTTEGWQTFMTTLTASGNLSKAIDHKMVVSAVATGAPIVLSQGELASRYSWKVQVPLLVTYQTATSTQHQNIVATMLIVRTSTAEGTRGLGIKQFIAIAQPQTKVQFAAAGANSNTNAKE